MLRLHGYSLERLIRRDDHVSVHRGHRDDDRLPVVAKVLDAAYPRATDLAQLRHEDELERNLALDLALGGIAAPLELVEHGHGLALIWTDPGGVPLRSLLDAGPVDLPLALAIASSLAETLARVHGCGVIFKNLGPDEVFVDPQSGRTCLFGFGLAARLAQEKPLHTSPAALEGALAYLAPEQTGRMNRVIDRRSDLYALGTLLYELLTGGLPFATTDVMALIHAHLARRPEPPHQRSPGLPRRLSSLVMKLLEKSAEDRYQHARTVARDLRAYAARLATGADLDDLALARDDVDPSAALDIPQRLYGREAELAELRQAWARVDAGAGELLLVRGYSGIGKSVLVHEIHRELTGADGHFIAGKFDPLGRTIPYAPLIAAFEGLVQQLLAEPEAELTRFRDALLAGAGEATGVLTELIPALVRVVGEQPAVAELTGSASRRRLGRAVQALLRASTGGGRPLALFLDDLQWADLASLELLEQLLQDEVTRLLVIGAYRSNEVDAGHPLTASLRALAASGATVHAIELGPLARGDLLRFVADTLRMDLEQVAGLARQIYDKTEGNPFFAIRLLLALHEDRLLAYDEQARAYRWDEAAVAAVAAADNVVQFMAERLGKLPAATRRILELAACVGHRFDLRTLAAIAKAPSAGTEAPSAGTEAPSAGAEASLSAAEASLSAAEASLSAAEASLSAVAETLWPALEQGVIVALDERYRYMRRTTEIAALPAIGFRFLHDRVQQAAYAGIDVDERPALHLQIGRLLQRSCEPTDDEHDVGLFQRITHLNLGRARIDDPHERAALARLNAVAGARARAATAYEAAAEFFAAGVSLLGAQAFTQHPALAYALHLGAAEAAMLAGDLAKAEAGVAHLLAHVRDDLERAAVLDLQVVASAAQGRSLAAVEAGVAGLRLLGVEVPESQAERRQAYARALEAVLATIDAHGIEALVARPAMAAPRERLALQLARHTSLSAFGPATDLAYWLTALAALLSLEHGTSDQSSSAYALLGAVLASTTRRYAQAHALVSLAMAVHEARGGGVHEACMLGFYFTTVSHYAMPWRELLPGLERARVAGVEAGDLLFHSYTCSHLAIARLILGDPLDAVRVQVEDMLAQMQRHNLASAAATQRVVRQTIACLEGRSAGPTSLTDPGCDEDELVATMVAARMSFALYWYRTSKGALRYLDGDPVAALAELEQVLTMTPMAFTPEARFFTALALLALATDHSLEQAALLADCRRDLEIWAAACPANYGHRHLLVEAELARREGRREQAMTRYDQAISAAGEHRWPRDQAIASELAARFYLDGGHPRIARAYMTDAVYAYARWGATARVRVLAERFPALVPIDVRWASLSVPADDDLGDEIDMRAFARSLQTITREVVLEDVVERVMQIVLQSAGAERGVLVLERDGQRVIYAEAIAEPLRVSLDLDLPVEDSETLPLSVIRYVTRTGEAAVLDDATGDERFAGDPYIARVRPRSVVCMAMSQRGRGRGLLYLENNAATAAFTRARLELLELLSAQAVIAIDNADLYARVQQVKDTLAQANARLEREVDERTTALSLANERLTVELRERALAETERGRLQAQRLSELTTPVLPIGPNVLLMPLIGSLDEARACEVLEVAADGAHARRARVVILDVTGIKNTDGGVASLLAATARVLRYVGAMVIVSGVSPAMALALADQPEVIEAITVCPTLEAGVAEALARAKPGGPKPD